MELGRSDWKRLQLLLADVNPWLVGSIVQFRLDLQALASAGVGDEIDHHLVAEERPTPPILRDMAEHAMLDAVPFARARRKMADAQLKTRFFGELAEFTLPELGSAGIASTAVCGNHQSR